LQVVYEQSGVFIHFTSSVDDDIMLGGTLKVIEKVIIDFHALLFKSQNLLIFEGWSW